MTPNEINIYMRAFESTLFVIINIITKYINDIPEQLITELENFYQSKRYEADVLLENSGEIL